MDRFSQAYKKARKIVRSRNWPGDWNDWLDKEWNVPGMMEKSGLNHKYAFGLDKYREKLNSLSSASPVAKTIVAVNDTELKGIKAWFSAGNGVDRVASLKMLKHS